MILKLDDLEGQLENDLKMSYIVNIIDMNRKEKWCNSTTNNFFGGKYYYG